MFFVGIFFGVSSDKRLCWEWFHQYMSRFGATQRTKQTGSLHTSFGWLQLHWANMLLWMSKKHLFTLQRMFYWTFLEYYVSLSSIFLLIEPMVKLSDFFFAGLACDSSTTAWKSMGLCLHPRNNLSIRQCRNKLTIWQQFLKHHSQSLCCFPPKLLF